MDRLFGPEATGCGDREIEYVLRLIIVQITQRVRSIVALIKDTRICRNQKVNFDLESLSPSEQSAPSIFMLKLLLNYFYSYYDLP